jgi:tRNA A37 N6-isopentenylltransferase MiaA
VSQGDEDQWVNTWGASEQRGRTPIVVGGTGFYLRWYVHGKPSTPRSTSASAAAAELALERVRMRPQLRALQLMLWLMPCC